jgi:nucleoid-associated protein YgaU
MIGAMTERSATGTERQVVCPFVAFDDDRDYRSSVPDHRHRCFGESPAASRALAHQAAYCLSSAFPGCPTFIDWARREAAPPKDGPIRTLREMPTAPRQAERSGEAAGRPDAPQAAPAMLPRQRRAEWTAPPPWAPNAGAADPGLSVGEAGGDDAGRAVASARDAAPAPEDADASPGLGAWSGSALGGLAASGSPADDQPARPVEPPAGADREAELVPSEPAAPAFLAGRASPRNPSARAPLLPAHLDKSRGTQRAEPSPRGAVGYTPGDPSRRRVPGRGRAPDPAIGRDRDRAVDRGPDRAVVDPSGPSWERPRRIEAYPSLKSSGGGVAALPRPVLYGLIVLIVGIALFATPFLLHGLTGGGATASPTPGASASPGASAAASATPVPSPSPTVYTVKAGDTLSRIAKKYGVTVDQIVKVNPQIKNPDKLGLGDQLVIPTPVEPAITDGTITPAP